MKRPVFWNHTTQLVSVLTLGTALAWASISFVSFHTHVDANSRRCQDRSHMASSLFRCFFLVCALRLVFATKRYS